MFDWILRNGAALLIFAVILGVGAWAILNVVNVVRRYKHGYDGDDFEAKPCRKCGYDLRASTDRCPECGEAVAEPDAYVAYMRQLSEEWPGQPVRPRIPDVAETQVMLLSTGNANEAQLVREQLLTRGIPCSVQVHEFETHAGVVRRTYFHRVVVYSGDEELARAYLERVGCPSVVDSKDPNASVTEGS